MTGRVIRTAPRHVAGVLACACCLSQISVPTLAQRSVYPVNLPDNLYENGEYLIHGRLRRGTICVVDPPAPNHGFIAYFDGRPCGDWADDRPKVAFFVAYNVAYDATSTLDLARHLCDPSTIVASDLRIDDLRFAKCRQRDRQGLGVIDYVALRPPLADESTDPYGGMEMDFTIYARKQDLSVYRDRTYRLAAELHLSSGPRE